MRSAERAWWLAALVLLPLSASPHGESLSAVHQQRYSMGTMFDILVYHTSHVEAERAVAQAMDEILRLERVMSHYRADSDLANLNRRGGAESVAVDPSLHEVIRESLAVSRQSGGRFDVTIAPLLRVWRGAAALGRRPSHAEIEAARRCVGYENIEMAESYRVRFWSECVEIDLGGIGKGYAVDRAFAILRAAGVRHALINAGGSSITAMGAPPDRNGWPVLLGATVLVLHGNSLSTSEQNPATAHDGILDPLRGAPADSRFAVSVVAPSATLADALSTTLVMLSVEEGRRLAAQFADVSALWISAAGQVHAAFRESQLELRRAH
jgi:thiamine biosynthesis lipoprotein